MSIVHCKKEPFDIYIGRPSKWENTYVIGKDGSRRDVIQLHKQNLYQNSNLLFDIVELENKTLACWCHPKPCHGNTYLTLLKERNMIDEPITIFTDGSTSPNPGPSGYGYYLKLANGNEYNCFGGLTGVNTNNIAEIRAVTEALRFVIRHPKIPRVTIKSDSRYVVDGIRYTKKWIKNNWISSQGTNVVNKEHWVELLETIKLVQQNSVFKIEHIKAHVGKKGNTEADINANLGRLECINEQWDHVENIITPTLATPMVTKTKVKVLPLNPLISGKRWFFLTNNCISAPDQQWIYSATTYEDKVKDRNKNAGKRSSDSHFSILITPNPITILEDIKLRYTEKHPVSEMPIIVNLANVGKKTVWDDLYINGTKSIRADKDTLIDTKGNALATVVSPPKLIFNLTDYFRLGLNTLLGFIKGDIDSTEITDYIYTKSDKGKQKVSSDFTNQEKTMTIDNHLASGRSTNVILTVGLDLPNRNTFSGVLKDPDNKDIRVFLLSVMNGKKSFNIFTAITIGDTKSIHYSPDSNYRIYK